MGLVGAIVLRHGMERIVRALLALACSACAGVALPGAALAQTANAAPPACLLEAVGTSSVRTIIDGRTLVLADGREVRLAGIEILHSDLNEAGARAAKVALETFAGGREIALKRLGAETDRHGRLLAYVFVPAAPVPDREQPRTPEPSAQEILLSQGHARVAARVGSPACAAALLAAERTARTARLGLWADPHYVMRRAERPAEILAERGRFTLVEGKVQSVRESGATIYVNFGRRWTEDFTVTVLKRSERAFTASGLELKKLAGRHVRVRGFVEERGGPWIEATRPEQIEIAEQN